jgi:phosphoserine phosphatase RsbU/P
MSPIELTSSKQSEHGDNAIAEPSRSIDPSASRRVQIVMDMVKALSRADQPQEVQRAFADGLMRLEGPRGYVSLSIRGLAPGEYKFTRFHNTRDPIDFGATDPWKNWSTMPVHRGGFFGQIISNPRPQLIERLNLRDDPIVGDRLAHYRSMMAIPLFENGIVLNWSIQFSEDPEGFSVTDVEKTLLTSNLGGATVRNVLITKQLRDANEIIRRDIQEIARIQRALLPQSLPQVPGISIATSYETYDTAGGDLYDLVVLPERPTAPTRFDGWLAMVIADAAGHGPGSAVLAAILNTLLYAYPRSGQGPGALFEFANQHLFSKRIDGTFVTAFFAALNPKDHTLVYARAGHNPPLIKNAGAGGSVIRVDDVGGLPLGIVDDATYDMGTRNLNPGQTLVLYTDGITEAMNPQREMFGVEGIERALHECSGEPACVVNSIMTALRAHEAGARPGDDQTIVALKVE